MRKDSRPKKNNIQEYVNVNGRISVGRRMRRETEDITEWIAIKNNEATRITEDRQRRHNVLLNANSIRMTSE